MRFRDKGDLVIYLRRIWDQKIPTIIVLGSDQKYNLTNYEIKMNCKIFFLFTITHFRLVMLKIYQPCHPFLCHLYFQMVTITYCFYGLFYFCYPIYN